MLFLRNSVSLCVVTALFVVSFLSVGCDSASDTSSGRIVVKLTDMPFPFDEAASANVVIERVDLIGVDSTESLVLTDSAQAFNLLDLRDGVTADLVDVSIPDGRYSQLRLVVAEEAAVVMKDSTIFDLKIPSGNQTGIKIKLPDFEVAGPLGFAEVTVDFDVSKSFVVRGNPRTVSDIKGFIFKPVLKVIAFELDGTDVQVDSTAS